jgi:hypothetical protein
MGKRRSETAGQALDQRAIRHQRRNITPPSILER